MFLLWHPSLTAINLSYTFPILETSATALCGTTGRNIGTSIGLRKRDTHCSGDMAGNNGIHRNSLYVLVLCLWNQKTEAASCYFSFRKSSTKLISVCPAKAMLTAVLSLGQCEGGTTGPYPAVKAQSWKSAFTWLRSSECETTSRSTSMRYKRQTKSWNMATGRSMWWQGNTPKSWKEKTATALKDSFATNDLA